MWENHFVLEEGMIFTTVDSRIGREQRHRTLPCPAALDSKSTARKIVKEPLPFRDAEPVLLSEIPTSTVGEDSLIYNLSPTAGIASQVSPASLLRYKPLPFVPA